MPTDKQYCWSDYDAQFQFIWVLMSEFSESGARGAPTGLFFSKDEAVQWAKSRKIEGNIYRLPLGISLADYCEPMLGDQKYIVRHFDKFSAKYLSGKGYLGFIEHEHISNLD